METFIPFALILGSLAYTVAMCHRPIPVYVPAGHDIYNATRSNGL